MLQFSPGDRVSVRDPFLARIRQIMIDTTGSAEPNNTGTVERVEGNEVIINFDDGCAAPYKDYEVDLLA